MAKLKHSEVAAKLAIEGAVGAIAGTVKGQLGLEPRVLGKEEKIDLGMIDVGNTLFYPIDDGGVFLQSDGAYTTIWFGGADYRAGADALDALIKRHYPDAKKVKDEAHESQPDMKLRTYDIRLPNNHLAIVDSIYPSGSGANPKFMIRVTAMARQN